MKPNVSRAEHPAAAGLPGWTEALTRLLDDVVRVPGTRVGFGLDALLGLLVPGLGDAVTGVGSIGLLLLALRLRLPTVVIGRMLVNIAIDVLLGMVPFVGDLFDFAWKANRLNLELIEKHRHNPQAMPSALDYLLVGLGLVLAIIALAMPIILWIVYGAALASLGSALLSR